VFVFVQAGDDLERQPLVHALLPKERIFVDHSQAKQVVDLLQREDFLGFAGNPDAPKVICSDAHRGQL
jgi:hypothetical protein